MTLLNIGAVGGVSFLPGRAGSGVIRFQSVVVRATANPQYVIERPYALISCTHGDRRGSDELKNSSRASKKQS